ncbi:hypothetical protein HYFRA_00008655 [Hymenoscyphus fraxineus]|uniref:Uncharacterized protein n=1 Tax=Hymenoscyphus fraxineus TaxID=746836 RepID=A0A9N9PPS3_9HELO|nr:hypothetical protein HYFRA_00008655 [Hymenoscyphus fraxineus]
MESVRRHTEERSANEQPPANTPPPSRIVTLNVRFPPVDTQDTQVAQATGVNETSKVAQSTSAPTESSHQAEVATGPTSAANVNTTDAGTDNSISQGSGKKRLVWGHNRNSKHGPVAPRGTVFLMNQNTHLDQSRANVGKPEPTKLRIKFKDTQGNLAIHKYPRRQEAKWDDPAWVSNLNKWRSQTFRRTFRLDPAFVKNETRTKWTIGEFEWFKRLLKKRAKTTRTKMSLADFKKIARKHNRRWEGETIRVGEALHKGKGNVVKKAQTIPARTATALQAMYLRDPNLLNAVYSYIPGHFVRDEDGEYELDVDGGDVAQAKMKEGPNGQGDDEDSNMADVGGDSETSDETSDSDNYNEGETDAHLEDSSDDEMDGMRPASNQTGAVPIPA